MAISSAAWSAPPWSLPNRVPIEAEMAGLDRRQGAGADAPGEGARVEAVFHLQDLCGVEHAHLLLGGRAAMEHGEEVFVEQLAGGGRHDHLALAQPVVSGDQAR